MPPFLRRPSLCLARNCFTVRQFGPLESIDPNDAMILPHGSAHLPGHHHLARRAHEGKVFLRDIIDLEATYAGPDAKVMPGPVIGSDGQPIQGRRRVPAVPCWRRPQLPRPRL
jgi:hypothetical protein